MVATKVSGFLSDHREIYAFTEIWDKIVNQAVLCQVHKAGNSTVLLPSCLSLSSACYFCLLCLSDLDFQLLIVVSDSFGFLKKYNFHMLFGFTVLICSLWLSNSLTPLFHEAPTASHICSGHLFLWPPRSPPNPTLPMELTGTVLALRLSDGDKHGLLFSPKKKLVNYTLE